MNPSLTDETICGHLGEELPHPAHAVIPPIFMTSLHTFDTMEEYLGLKGEPQEYIYGRVSNPTTALLEKKLNALEHGHGCLCFGSGMNAITSTILACVQPGGHVVAVGTAYGGAHGFLSGYLKEKMNVSVTYVRGDDPAAFEAAITPETQLFYLESPSSFVFVLQDLPVVTSIAKKHGIKTIIDNTWATPLFQKPIDMGVDIVIHTLSKYVGGHSDIIGGAAIFADEAMFNRVKNTERSLLGGILGPFESWLALRGLRTLPARIQVHQRNAMTIAERLVEHPAIKKVFYPGHPSYPQYELAKKQLGGYTGLLSIIPNLSLEKTMEFTDRLKLFKIGCSWGGFESLAIMPLVNASPEELKQMGAEANLVRLHIGQENVEDLWNDLNNALNV